MALLKRFPLECFEDLYQHYIDNKSGSDFNHCIVYCVAALQQERGKG